MLKKVDHLKTVRNFDKCLFLICMDKKRFNNVLFNANLSEIDAYVTCFFINWFD